jgi:hypothetical protein
MENIILQGITRKDFQEIIGGIVRDELKQFKPEPPQPATSEYLTRREVCTLLKISLATLHYYTKDGLLKSYRIRGRVLYKTVEVQNSLVEIQAGKYKHGRG